MYFQQMLCGMNKPFVIQREAKDLVYIHVYVSEIFRTESSTTRLPPFGRLNDNNEKK